MHELGIAHTILDAALDVAGRRRVAEVRVLIGALHGVSADSLGFGFHLLAAETTAAGAHLVVIAAPARTVCSDCADVVDLRAMPPACASCGSMGVAVRGGRELCLEELTLVDDPGAPIHVGRDLDEGADGHHHDDHHAGSEERRRVDLLATGAVRPGEWPFD